MTTPEIDMVVIHFVDIVSLQLKFALYKINTKLSFRISISESFESILIIYLTKMISVLKTQ